MKIKKLFSVLACSFLLIGGGTLLAAKSASKAQARQVKADVTTNSTYQGIYSDGFNNTQKFDGYNQVLIVYDGVAHGLSGDITDQAVLNQISINGTPLTSLAVTPWADQTWFNIIYPANVVEGDVLEVTHGFTLGDAVLKGFKLKLNSNLKWERYYDTVDLGNIIFTGVLSNSTNSAIYFYTLQTNAISTGWSAMNYVSGTIALNSTDISSGAKIQKANVHDYYFPIGSNANVNDVLTIEAEFQGLDSDIIYHFGVQRLQVKWDGSAWNFVGQDVGTVEFESVHGASNNANLYLKGKETYDVFPQAWDPAQYCSYYPVSNDGYVTINGMALASPRLRKVPEIQPGYYWYLELGGGVLVDAVVRIGGKWEGCGFSFTIDEFVCKWDGSNWVDPHLIVDDELIKNSDYVLFGPDDYEHGGGHDGWIFYTKDNQPFSELTGHQSFGIQFTLKTVDDGTGNFFLRFGQSITSESAFNFVYLNNRVYIASFKGAQDDTLVDESMVGINLHDQQEHFLELYLIKDSATTAKFIFGVDGVELFKTHSVTISDATEWNFVSLQDYDNAGKMIVGTSPSTDVDALERFSYRALHMDTIPTSDTEDTGACRGENGYYTKAKAYYNDYLTPAQRVLFATDESYEEPKDRLVAWATANGETISFDATTGELIANSRINFLSTSIENKSAEALMIICSAIALISLSTFFVIRKRKHM